MRNKKIWIFNSGNSFDGNPKWLFMYIVNHRPDITPYWFCYNEQTLNYVKKLGYNACMFNSKECKRIGAMAGVYVVNQRKEVFQPYLSGITVLNLWHGVGCKAIEKNVKAGFLNEGIVKKNIRNMNTYRNNELFLVTSPLMEKHFTEQCGLEEHSILRGGYPNCFNTDKVTTYDHDLLKGRNLPENTKIVMYAPTFRDSTSTNFFSTAVPDVDRLIECLEKNDLVMIMKMHPFMNNDFYYQNIKNKYADCPRLIFWDNINDIYEVTDQIDLAIVDYSSIFYDLLARGVKHFIRYIFDYNNKENLRDFALDYMEHTCGSICENFDSLLDTLGSYEQDDLTEELGRIKKLFWEYAEDSSMDSIINQALAFQPIEGRKLPTLYSFDIFDTLIARTTLAPAGIFYYVQDKLNETTVEFPRYFKENYFKIRPWAEKDVREYYNKSVLYRHSDKLEISFDLIFDHIKNVYGMSDEQVELLKEWELEAEYKSTIPIKKNIDILKDLKDQGETVVLISDMYLPKAFIQKMLAKADPILAELPLFLSSETGNQKTQKTLFYEVYHELNYNFGKWIHRGDSQKADIDIPKKLDIKTIKQPLLKFGGYENSIIEFIKSYDAYQIARLMQQFRTATKSRTLMERYAYCYVSLYFVPYVNWAVKQAISKGIECLYFISRDGYHLKRIADAIIEEKGYKIKTKYIYGSRKLWRIPSQIDSIDEEFWSNFGNFVEIKTFQQLLDAAALTEEEFDEIFPELSHLKTSENIDAKTLARIRELFSVSDKYRTHLLAVAAQQRVIVDRYLKQEIDFSEKYAFVEYWGRGYTQTCLAKLIWDITGRKDDNIFFYARTIYPTHDNIIRYNFTANNFSLIFIETIFANMPYRSVSKYTENEDGIIEPVIVPCENDSKLHELLEKYLPQFAHDYAKMELENEDAIGSALFDFSLSYFHRHPNDPVWINCFAQLKDSVAAYGKVREWAPAMTWGDVMAAIKGQKFSTNNMDWSIKRSSKSIQKAFNFYAKHLRGKKFTEKVLKLCRKIRR